MARVPQYNGGINRAGIPGAGFGVQASDTAMGGGSAAAVGAVADATTRIAFEEKQHADQVAVLAAQAEHGAGLNEIEAQVRQARGADALKRGEDGTLTLQQDALKQYDSLSDQISAKLTNDTQRSAFQADAARSRVALDGSIRDHVLRESDAYEADSLQSLVSNSRAAALTAGGDPVRVGYEIGRQQQALTEYAQRHGKPPEWVQEQTADAASKTHSGVIDEMLARGADQSASDYFKAHGDEVVGGDKVAIERALDISSTRGESQKQADTIIAAAADQSAALKAAGLIADPKLRDETTARVQKYYSDQREALAGSQQDAFNQGLQAFNDPANAKGIDGVPANLLAAMGPHREALESYAARRAKREAPTTDQVLYYKLQTAASDPNTAPDFVKEYLPAYIDRLAPADFQELTKLQASMREKSTDKEAQAKLTWGITSREQLMAGTFQTLNIKTGEAASPDDAAKANALRGMVDRGVVALQAREKRQATEEEVRKVISSVVAASTIHQDRSRLNPYRWFGDTQSTTIDPTKAPALAFETGDVPADAMAAIRQEMTAQGKHLTDDQVVDIYNQNLIRKSANAR